MASDNNYQLILLDVRLPGISGIQVCSELRKLGSNTPIMMLTARSLVEQRVEGLDAGADDYLNKPFAYREQSAGEPACERCFVVSRHADRREAQYALVGVREAAPVVRPGGRSIGFTTNCPNRSVLSLTPSNQLSRIRPITDSSSLPSPRS
jgi:CheY-like chemotaxis protein